jgi:hypothetical protein
MIDLFHLSNILFFETFKGAQPLSFLVEGSHNFAEVPQANNFVLLKLFDFRFVGLFDSHFTGPLGRLVVKLRIVKLVLQLAGLVLLLNDGFSLP